MVTNKPATGDFPSASATLESFGLKFITGPQYFPIRGAGSLIWMLTVQRDSVRKLIVLAF